METDGLSAGARHTLQVNPRAFRRLFAKQVSDDVYTSSLMAHIIEQSSMQILDRFETRNRPTSTKSMSIEHLARAIVDHDVTVELEIITSDAFEISFNVRCFDSSGQIGSGVHTRAFADQVSSFA